MLHYLQPSRACGKLARMCRLVAPDRSVPPPELEADPLELGAEAAADRVGAVALMLISTSSWPDEAGFAAAVSRVLDNGGWVHRGRS